MAESPERQRLLDAVRRREEALAYAHQGGGGKGTAQTMLNLARRQLKDFDAKARKPTAAKPAAAATPAPTVTPLPQVVDTPVAPPKIVLPLPENVSGVAPGGEKPAERTAEQPTLANAEARTDAQAPAAQLDPQGTPAKRKKYGVASTILTGASGLANLGSVGTRMLLG